MLEIMIHLPNLILSSVDYSAWTCVDMCSLPMLNMCHVASPTQQLEVDISGE